MKKFFSSRLFTVILFVTVPVSAYFINIEVQSYLGRRALEATGLEKLSLQDAVARAGRSEKLVLVEVSAIWCSVCRRLDNEVFADGRVKDVIRERFEFSRVDYDTDEGQRFLEERGAYGVPHIYVLNGDGRTVTKLNVIFDPVDFAEQLKRVADQSS